MSYQIIFTPSATRDLTRIYDYYESIHSGYGEKFLVQVALRHASLMRNPEAYSIKHSKHYREAIVKNYPYLIYFIVIPDENTVVIHRIVGTSQDR
jgi:plasmid stabilization system protein ParE